MLITRHNGHEDTEFRDEFPVAELQKGTKCQVRLGIGETWNVEIEEAHAQWIKTKCTVRDNLPCETCGDNRGIWCDRLQHPLESGYAMRHHAKRCGRGAEGKAHPLACLAVWIGAAVVCWIPFVALGHYVWAAVRGQN